jgi:hypothetical protein
MVVSLAKRACVLATLGLAASTACGGISTRHVGENESGSGGNGETGGNGSGGRGSGGRGSGGSTTGVGGVGADGGAFTAGGVGGVGGGDGGSFAGGVGASGGVGAVGGVGVGGTIPVAGGIGGVGAFGGSGAVGGSVPVGGQPSVPYRIPWESNGYVSPHENQFGIEGNLYFSTDCAAASTAGLPCTEGDPNFVGPDGQVGWALSDVVACVRGSAPQVINDPTTGMPAYDLQWGALLGIALWDPASGATVDATSRGIIGFTFDIVGVAPSDVRVNLVTPETIGVSHFFTVPLPGVNGTVLFSEVLQGPWVLMPRPFDPTQLSSIEFHVYTNASAPRPFDFCIMNLRAVPG